MFSRRTLFRGAGAALGTGLVTGCGSGRAAGPVPGVAALVQDPVRSIAEVAERLAAVRDLVRARSEAGDRDGIACFTRLYCVITETVDAHPFADRAFLTRLDLEFAGRYFAALRTYATDPPSTPGCWRLLFDRRTDITVDPARFAAAGVNAHINYDLAAALLATWPDFPPDDVRRGDYDGVNDVFADRMDRLRQMFGTALSVHAPPGGAVDVGANAVCDLTVRLTRTAAWDLAIQAWRAPDRASASEEMQRRLDAVASIVGHGLLAVGMPA